VKQRLAASQDGQEHGYLLSAVTVEDPSSSRRSSPGRASALPSGSSPRVPLEAIDVLSRTPAALTVESVAVCGGTRGAAEGASYGVWLWISLKRATR